MVTSAYRRAAAILIAGVAAAGYAGFQTLSPWFSHHSGMALTPYSLSSAGVVSTSTGLRPVMALMAGAPAPLTLLAVGVTFAGAGFVLRLGLLPVIGAASVWLARSAATHSEILLLSGRYTEDFVLTPGSTYPAFLAACWITLTLMLVLCAQITYAGHLERRQDPEAEAGILDTLGAVQTAAVGRFARAARA